jgi:RNA polymerase sigma-70 factor (ECF subfamily)
MKNISEWYDAFLRFARARIRRLADMEAEDFVQEALLELLPRLDPAYTLEQTLSYVYTALRRRIIDYFRRQARRQKLADQLPASPDLPNPEQALLAAEEAEQLAQAIAALSESDQALLWALEYENRSFRELSEKLDRPVGSLLAQKHRAVRKMRRSLDAMEGGDKHVLG